MGQSRGLGEFGGDCSDLSLVGRGQERLSRGWPGDMLRVGEGRSLPLRRGIEPLPGHSTSSGQMMSKGDAQGPVYGKGF